MHSIDRLLLAWWSRKKRVSLLTIHTPTELLLHTMRCRVSGFAHHTLRSNRVVFQNLTDLSFLECLLHRIKAEMKKSAKSATTMYKRSTYTFD